MSGIGDLIAIEGIKPLKSRYFRLMDPQDGRAFPEVFADDLGIYPS